MKVRSSDFMYSMYCFPYQLEGTSIPEPKNLCRYWWLSVWGLLLWILVRRGWYVFAASAITCAAIIVDMVAMRPARPSVVLAIPLVLASFAVAIYAGVSLYKLHKYLEGKGFGNLLPICFAVGIGYSLACLIGNPIFDLGYLLSGLLLCGILLSLGLFGCLGFAIVCGVCYKTGFGVAMREYGKATKQRMCPLIEVEEQADEGTRSSD